AFDGAVLGFSERLKLLEEADNRKIRRGDALDLIQATQRELETRHAVKSPNKSSAFIARYAGFAAVYIVVALGSCVIVGANPGSSSRWDDRDTNTATAQT